MARRRLVSPEFFQHGGLYDAEAASGLPLRLAFAGLWTVADRRGVFSWKPREIKLAILPYDQVDFGAVLSALESAGFVERYEAAGRQFGRIPSFSRWQTFHKHEKPSDAPDNAEGCTEPANGCREPSSSGQMDVSSTAITGTVAVAGTSAGIVVVEDSAADEIPESVTEPTLTATYVAIWSNSAVTERWNEQPSPFTPGQSVAMADLLRNGGVEWQVVRDSIYRQCRESKGAVPPRSPNYFRPGVEKHWEQELARRALVASGERPPSEAAASSGFGGRRENWTDKNARLADEEGIRQRARICAGNVDVRRNEADGPAWYTRMQRESKALGVHVTLYAYDHMHEAAEAVAHVG